MTEANRISFFWGALITVVLWAILFTAFVFIKIPEKTVYETINITFSPTETPSDNAVQESIKKSTAEVEKTPSSSIDSESDKQENKENLTVKEKGKTETKNPLDDKASASDAIVYKQSIEDMAKNQKNKRKSETPEWDESLFADSDTITDGNTEISYDDIPLISSLEGVVASHSKYETIETSVYSSSNDVIEESSEVSNILNAISNRTYTDKGDGSSGFVEISSAESGSGVSIKMSDGKVRTLLRPAEPVLSVSKENAQELDNSRKVSIRFTVLPDGTVPKSGIFIEPSISVDIDDEIKDQVSRWIFAKEPSGHNAEASFIYRLEIR